MKLDWKVIAGGGVVMYIAEFFVGGVTGMAIHQGALEPLYQGTTEFWRPELNQDPPDMAAVMPGWIAVGVLSTMVHAGIYDNIRSAFGGSNLVTGAKFGLVLALIYAMSGLGLSGIFGLPKAIWGWWMLEWFIVFPAGGLALGWFVGKFGSD